ncbi:hypothetical protein GOP47_0003636 [Adiantum capillus-veneris]|uniref:Uncharacterized protein n=1 Tax=Adiantum capillus-veneris TaxID=13818 RepID=A0A9D4ZLV2_ADICA|nr:hypothetical protein GOP47_0003636 [Adiantum capillus-veneris]
MHKLLAWYRGFYTTMGLHGISLFAIGTCLLPLPQGSYSYRVGCWDTAAEKNWDAISTDDSFSGVPPHMLSISSH